MDSFKAVLMIFVGKLSGGGEGGDTFMIKCCINLTADHTEFLLLINPLTTN